MASLCTHEPRCFSQPLQMLTFRRERDWAALAHRTDLAHKARWAGCMLQQCSLCLAQLAAVAQRPDPQAAVLP